MDTSKQVAEAIAAIIMDYDDALDTLITMHGNVSMDNAGDQALHDQGVSMAKEVQRLIRERSTPLVDTLHRYPSDAR